jgi:hypothetical protein
LGSTVVVVGKTARELVDAAQTRARTAGTKARNFTVLML